MTSSKATDGKPLHASNKYALHGKVALVTGASRGIGKAIALSLAANGAHLALFARNQEALNSVKEEIEPLGRPCLAQSGDICKEEDIDRVVRLTEKKLGPIAILVNNAGIYKTEPVEDHDLASWAEIVDINLTGAMLASRRVLKPMKAAEWGRIINISSVSGQAGEAFGAAYSASKFGLIGLTQSLALEVAKYAITVNAVCPGWVMTEMAKEQLNDETWCGLNDLDASQSEEIARLSVPQMRFIEPYEVGQLVAFLCSDDARGITGQAINICGGLSI